MVAIHTYQIMRFKKSSKKILSGRKISYLPHIIRGFEVMLDFDLANLFQTTTGHLNEAVKRNKDKFPSDFMFRLTDDEFENLISQIAISSLGIRGRDRNSSLDVSFGSEPVASPNSNYNSTHHSTVEQKAVSKPASEHISRSHSMFASGSGPKSKIKSEWGGRRHVPYAFTGQE